VKSLGTLDQVIELLCSLRVVAVDKFNLNDSNAKKHCRVDVDPVDSRPKMKTLTSDSHMLSDLDSVASLNKEHPDEGVAGLQPTTVVDSEVQGPRHWSGEHHRA
jgi:hypothetical protein